MTVRLLTFGASASAETSASLSAGTDAVTADEGTRRSNTLVWGSRSGSGVESGAGPSGSAVSPGPSRSGSGSSAKSMTIFWCSACRATVSSSTPTPARSASAAGSATPSMSETTKASNSLSRSALRVSDATTMGTPTTVGNANTRVGPSDAGGLGACRAGRTVGTLRWGNSSMRRTTLTSALGLSGT